MYIFCDCSDCGHSRVKGPCYLETYYADKSNLFVKTVRTQQKELKGFPNTFYKIDDEYIKNSVLQVTLV
jgi:hypothetical protein